MTCPNLLPQHLIRAWGLLYDSTMNCSLEARMLAQNTGLNTALLGGCVSKNVPHTGGTGRLAVKWWGRSNIGNFKKQNPSKSHKVGGAWRRKLLILWVLSGIVASLWIFHCMNAGIVTRRQEMLASMCDERARMLQDQFAVSMNHVHALAILVSTFYHGKQPAAIDQEDRENILRARATGKGVLTSPFTLESNHLGVVLTFAVYNTDLPPDATPEERIEATTGYLGGAFDVESLVENLLRQLAGKQAIIVNVYDITNSSRPFIMYGPPVTYNGLSHVSTLDFGDPFRKHEMLCRFTQKPSLPWSAITTSLGILVIALLVGHIFHAALNRIAKVEDDFRKMEELKVRAEAADIAKSQFLATVSHEIRTPMNGVLGMLQMLMDTELDATQQDFARTAQASGKALITLINEVLDQAKIESGRLELEAVPFDLRAILDDVLSSSQ